MNDAGYQPKSAPPTKASRKHTCRRSHQGLIHRVVRHHERRLAVVLENGVPAEARARPELAHGVVAVDLEVGGVLLPHGVLLPEPGLALLLEEAL
jgi:hypothetical protein